jgi:hypothetical protein
MSKKVMGTENLNSSLIVRVEQHQKGYPHTHSAETKDNSRCFNTKTPTMDKIKEFVKANTTLRRRNYNQIHRNMIWKDLDFVKEVTPEEQVESLCKNLLAENNALISNRTTSKSDIQCDPNCDFYSSYGKGKPTTDLCGHKSIIDQTL